MYLIRKKGYLKLGLDFVMFALLILLYKKNVINLMFHEVVGLGIIVLFTVHVLLNRKWVAAVTKRLFDPKLGGRLRVLYACDLLLVISFFMCGLSGILISKKLFPFHLTKTWIPLHFYFAAMSVLLVGIHLGLHFTMIKNTLSIVVPRAVCVILSAVVILGGIYSYSNSSMGRWLTAPFSSQTAEFHGQGGPGGEMQKGGETHAGPNERQGRGEKTMQEGHGMDDRNNRGNNGMGGPNGKNMPAPFSFLALLKLIASYASMILGISVITAITDKFLCMKKVNK